MIAAVVIAVGGYNLGRALLGPKRGADFAAYYVVGHLIRDGNAAEMYDTSPAFQARAAALGVKGVPIGDEGAAAERSGTTASERAAVVPFVYPPPAGMLLAPFSFPPYWPAVYLFFAVGLAAQLLGVALIFADRPVATRATLIGVAWAATLVFFPLSHSLYLGQVNSLVFLCCAGALFFGRRDQPWPAGFFVGLGTVLKLYPAMLLLFFLLKRQYRAVVSGLATVLGLALLSLPVVGVQSFQEFWDNALSRQYGLEPFFRNQGLNGALSRLFTENPYVKSLGDHPALVHWAVGVLSVAVLLTLVLVTWRRGDAPTPPRRYELEFGLFFVGELLILSTSWEHYGVFLLFFILPAAELLIRAVRSRRQEVLLLLLAFSFFVWAFVLETSDEYRALSTSLLTNAVFSLKFAATALLFVCGVLILRTRDGFWREQSEVSPRPG